MHYYHEIRLECLRLSVQMGTQDDLDTIAVRASRLQDYIMASGEYSEENMIRLRAGHKPTIQAALAAEKPAEKSVEKAEQAEPIANLKTPVSELDFSHDTMEELRRCNIKTVGDLVKWSANDLTLHRYDLYDRTVKEIEKTLAQTGLHLAQQDNVKEWPLEALNLPTRAYNALHNTGIKHVKDILKMDRDSLSQVQNLGKKSLEDIINKLNELGLSI